MIRVSRRYHPSALGSALNNSMSASLGKRSDYLSIRYRNALYRRSDRRALQNLRTIGRDSIGPLFDVEDINSLPPYHMGYRFVTQRPRPLYLLNIKGNFVHDPSSGTLRVGTPIPLMCTLYEFLKAYRAKTGNLDQILYEKNVTTIPWKVARKINRGIAKTLKNEPELFGLYNNGHHHCGLRFFH